MAKKEYTLQIRTIDIYLQKSIKFLYPLLKIDGAAKINPAQTYLAWDGEVSIHDCKLVCVYDLKENLEYKQFEKKSLQGNDFFLNFKDAEDNKRIYLFNLNRYKKDVSQFIKGRYSLMSKDTKNTILEYYKLNKISMEYMDSYLNPENYFESYAELLNVPEWRLRHVGELCDPLNILKETIWIKK